MNYSLFNYYYCVIVNYFFFSFLLYSWISIEEIDWILKKILDLIFKMQQKSKYWAIAFAINHCPLILYFSNFYLFFLDV